MAPCFFDAFNAFHPHATRCPRLRHFPLKTGFRVSFAAKSGDSAAMAQLDTRYSYFPSPVGQLLLAGSDERLECVSFPGGRGARKPGPEWREDDGAFVETASQLQAWFAGERTQFDLPLAAKGDPFQMRVWRALQEIAYGATATYGEIAKATGEPVSASRAVGSAIGANPLPIVIPCHRVIGAGGALVGFGGGLATKRYLLDLEFRVCPPRDSLFALI